MNLIGDYRGLPLRRVCIDLGDCDGKGVEGWATVSVCLVGPITGPEARIDFMPNTERGLMVWGWVYYYKPNIDENCKLGRPQIGDRMPMDEATCTANRKLHHSQ